MGEERWQDAGRGAEIGVSPGQPCFSGSMDCPLFGDTFRMGFDWLLRLKHSCRQVKDSNLANEEMMDVRCAEVVLSMHVVTVKRPQLDIPRN